MNRLFWVSAQCGRKQCLAIEERWRSFVDPKVEFLAQDAWFFFTSVGLSNQVMAKRNVVLQISVYFFRICLMLWMRQKLQTNWDFTHYDRETGIFRPPVLPAEMDFMKVLIGSPTNLRIRNEIDDHLAQYICEHYDIYMNKFGWCLH